MSRWRESFSFLPSISVGFADNRETDFLAFHPLHSSKPSAHSGSFFCTAPQKSGFLSSHLYFLSVFSDKDTTLREFHGLVSNTVRCAP